MTTTTANKNTWLRKLLARPAKKNRDWARVEEPDLFSKNIFVLVFTMVLLGFFGALIFKGSLLSLDAFVSGLAHFLYSINPSAPFEQLWIAFEFALIAMMYVLILISFIMFGHADEDDVVEMISDLDSNVQERLSELEEKIAAIERNV